MKRKITLDGRFSRSIAAVLSIFLTALLFASCEKEDATEPAVGSTENMNNARISPGTSPGIEVFPSVAPKSLVPEEALIYISHGACLGSCPAYTVTLMSNGNVLYTGNRYVGTLGTVKFNVGRDIAERISAEMLKSGFLDLRELYPAVTSDAARSVTALRIGDADDNMVTNGKVKVVIDYGTHVPTLLTELRQHIENQLGVDRLIQAGIVPAELPSQTNDTR